jgi:uncharacterized membrane protein (Fun14 family)
MEREIIVDLVSAFVLGFVTGWAVLRLVFVKLAKVEDIRGRLW